MNTVVKGCADCPMCHTDSEWPTICRHPLAVDCEDIKYSYTQKEYGFGSPDWCPLKKETITIELKQ